MQKIIRISLLVIWMFIIFSFSAVNGEKSTSSSVGIIKNVALKTSNVLAKIRIIHKPLNENQALALAHDLNYVGRKIMHASEYFILTLLIFNVLILYNLKRRYLYSFLASVIYAITDEFHQLFTGRTGSILDIFIDSIGIILAIGLIYGVNKIKTERR